MTYTTTAAPVLRWLLAAPLADPPTGRVTQLAEAIAVLGLEVSVDVGAALGAAGPVAAAVKLTRLRDFTVAGVLAASPTLARLQTLADRLGAAPERQPTPGELLAAVAEVAGEGALHAALAGLCAPPTAAAPAVSERPAAAREVRASSLLDEVLTQPMAPTGRTAALIDAVVRESRSTTPASWRPQAARAVRERLAGALARAARAVLVDPRVRAREALWRGLKLVNEQVGTRPKVALQLLDGGPEALRAWLEDAAEEAPMRRSDLVCLVGVTPELAALTDLARAAADAMVPVVVSVRPASFDQPDLAAVAALAEGAEPAAWTALRADDRSRWLAAAVNGMRVAADGAGEDARVLFADPALALMGLLVASLRDTGGLADLARVGALPSPAVWEAGQGQDHAEAPATEVFLSARERGRLAALGLIAIGGPRTGECLTVSTSPMVHAAPEESGLPAQVFAGRAVRLAQQVLADLPPGASPATIEATLHEAGSMVIVPGQRAGAAALEARVDAERDTVAITARVHRAIAGAPLELHFELPLRSRV